MRHSRVGVGRSVGDVLRDSPRVSAAYPVVEEFHSIQGEGAWAGTPAYFVRLAGCDVGCPWCDTKVSWDVQAHPVVPVDNIASNACASGAELAIVTGGEPTMHDLSELTRALRLGGLRVHLETSGAYPITGSFDWITLSPKKYRPPGDEACAQAHELKVIVSHKSDFNWGEIQAKRCNEHAYLALQPEWDSPHLVSEIVEYIKANPGWHLSLQIHKYLNLP